MPLRTVSLAPVPMPAMAVFQSRHRLQVSRIYTPRYTAQVIQLEPIWDWPDQKFVGDSMRQSRAATDSNFAVSIGLPRRLPDPAPRGICPNLLNDSVENGTRNGACHCYLIVTMSPLGVW